MYTEQIHARGHTNVRADHASTLEVTTDDWLTPAGDCILGIAANRAPADFGDDLIRAAQSKTARISLELRIGETTDRITGWGHPELTFASDRCLIARTSTYIDDRTIMINADSAATDIDDALVAQLKEGAALQAMVYVEPTDSVGD